MVLTVRRSIVPPVHTQVASQPDTGLLAACRTSFAHGPLLLLRYASEEVAWRALADSHPTHHEALRALLQRLLACLRRVAALAAAPLALPIEGVGAEEIEANEGYEADDADLGTAAAGDGDASSPDAQVIVTGCWLSVKEAVLLAGVLAHRVHFSAAQGSDVIDGDGGRGGGSLGGLLVTEDAIAYGRLLVDDIMLVIRHPGALDKAAIALTCLASELLGCAVCGTT